MKYCKKCGKTKPLSEFYTGRNGTDCKVCRRKYQRERQQYQRADPKEKLRKNRLKRLSKHKITETEFLEMVVKQNNRCDICNKSMEDKPYIDHDHETGKVRKLLCMHCNLGLGHFFDDLELLKNAIKYLKEHGKV